MRGILSQILAAAAVAGVADAAPWVREDGGWYARALAAHDNLDDAEGWRGDLYGEYGLTGALTLTAKAEAVTYTDYTEFDQQAYRVTLRRKLLERGRWTLGAEAGPVYGSTATGFVSCDGFGFETRAGVGYSGQRKGRSLYAFADVIYIQQTDDCQRARLEMGYGSDLTKRIFLSQQIWIEDGKSSADSIKSENQIGIHFDKFDAALGYRQELGGQFSEQAITVALVVRR